MKKINLIMMAIAIAAVLVMAPLASAQTATGCSRGSSECYVCLSDGTAYGWVGDMQFWGTCIMGYFNDTHCYDWSSGTACH